MKAMGIIFSNIYDSSLSELTKDRTVASLPFAARYRQIDFILSNMSNSGIRQIGIITKYNYRSLMDHLGSCQEWDLNLKNNDLVILPPYATGHSGVYRGKLEALYNSLDFLEQSDAEYVILSDSITICAIDLREVLNAHVASGCDMTAVVKNVSAARAKQVQIAVDLDEAGLVRDLRTDVTVENGTVGMGIYILRRTALIEAVKDCVSHGRYHLERDFFLRSFNDEQKKLSIYGYLFDGVVLFNASTPDYYRNSMALSDPAVFDGIFRQRGLTIYTKVRDAVPSYYGENSEIRGCLIADGCRLLGKAEHSILFRNVTIAESASVRDCIIMQGCVISEGAVLEGMILDKDVLVRPHTVLKGTKEHPLIIEKGVRI